jgi:hypothetical protein
MDRVVRRRFGPSLYFASDKVIFDALNQRSVPVDLIRELLRARGIFVSLDTPKEELARYFSRLPADYFDHRSIGARLGRVARPERVTSFELKSNISAATAIAALQALKCEIEDDGDTASVEVDKNLVLRFEYEHIDYTKAEFRQVQPRDALIELVENPTGGYLVRSSENQYARSVVERFCKRLEDEVGTPLERRSVTLEGHSDPRLRTAFFENLMRSTAGFDFRTVTEAFCYKARAVADNEDDDDEVELEEQPFVERVSLRGQGVNRSFVIDDLYRNGYYVVKTVWLVRPAGRVDADELELEAQFSNPASCSEFSYQVRTVHIREQGRLSNRKRRPLRDEHDALFRCLEEAAQIAYKAAIEGVGHA